MVSISRTLQVLPEAAHRSVTFDRGTEFAVLERELGVQSYFGKPQAPWQKGSFENLNGRLRRHLSLDSDIAAVSQENLKSLIRQLNATPRKCLGCRTPAEAFAALASA